MKVCRILSTGLTLALFLGACGPTAVPTIAPPPPSTALPAQTVTVFFGNTVLNPELQDCAKVYPVLRTVTVVTDTATAALRQLFLGPTPDEKAEGYVSTFSEATRDILIWVKVRSETAYVNLRDVRSIIPNASASCGSAAFFAEVESTLQAAVPVGRVIYAFESEPAAFYEWMQIGCEPNSYCDPTPFLEGGTPKVTPQPGEQVAVPDIGMTLTVPAGWQRQDGWTWVPAKGAEGMRLGLAWADRTPGQEAEALFFPPSSQVLGRTEEPELSWGTAATYRLAVLVLGGEGQVERYEVHVLVRGTDRYYDFWASAPTEIDLTAIEPALQELVASVRLGM
jgi:hypothetical protein